MNKIELKKKVKYLCLDVATATMMTTLALTYGLLIIAGEGEWWLLAVDTVLACLDWFIFSRDWKSFKNVLVLEENE